VPFILTFHRNSPPGSPPWERTDEKGNRVHFDLAAFRHIAYENPMQLRDLLETELKAWFDTGGGT